MYERLELGNGQWKNERDTLLKLKTFRTPKS